MYLYGFQVVPRHTDIRNALRLYAFLGWRLSHEDL